MPLRLCFPMMIQADRVSSAPRHALTRLVELKPSCRTARRTQTQERSLNGLGCPRICGCKLRIQFKVCCHMPADLAGQAWRHSKKPLPCPALPCPALPCPTPALPCPLRCAPALRPCPCPALPCPALPCPALPCPALPCPALPCPALPCPALPCVPAPALPCPALPCPALPCPG